MIVKIDIKKIINSLYEDKILVYGFEINNYPIGIIILQQDYKINWNIIYYFVHRDYRRKGIMTNLFNESISYLKKNNTKKIFLDFYNSRNFSYEIERFLISKGFFNIKSIKNIFIVDVSKNNKEKFLKMMTDKYIKYTKNFDSKNIKNILELNDQEKEIFTNQRGKEFNLNFCPLEIYSIKNKTYINIIYEKNDPAAWIINEKYGINSIYLNRIYVKRKYIMKGYFISLLYYAIKNYSENTTKLFFYVNNDNYKMLKILKKFDDYIISKEQCVKYFKNI